MIEFTNETLAGIPSIIYGLVGMLVFAQTLGFQTCLLSGSLTLVIMNLPTIIRTTQESLKTVPQGYREGALGLGAGKWHIIRTIVLPCSIDGIVTGCILAVGRIVGESAALLFTAGAARSLPTACSRPTPPTVPPCRCCSISVPLRTAISTPPGPSVQCCWCWCLPSIWQPGWPNQTETEAVNNSLRHRCAMPPPSRREAYPARNAKGSLSEGAGAA